MHTLTITSPQLLHLKHLSATTSYSPLSSIPFPIRTTTVGAKQSPEGPLIRCSISQIHNYGTVDFEKRPPLKWSSLYRKIATMEDPSGGPAAVLDRWDAEEHRLAKWDLCRIAKELRKFRRFKLALEVYDWMSARSDRFTFTSSDLAIKLDLIAKVHGITHAEEHFLMLDDMLKDKRTYGALLNAYGQAKLKEKTEATLETMRNKGYATDALPFNVTMTLYMNVGEREKVNTIISEMKEKDVAFDVFSYNIWITNCASMGDEEEMECVIDRMNSDSSINANWTTYTTLATMYIKLGNHEKAHSCLKDAEAKMTGRGRIPYNYLLGLYSSIGKKDEVYRIWDWYKVTFPTILNLGYQSMISSLIKLEDIGGAEAIYEEWVSTTSKYDPRICNVLLRWYAREGLVEKAKGVIDQLITKGGKPKPITWEILAEGHIKKKQVSNALWCIKEAASNKIVKNWRPSPAIIASLLTLCKEENNVAGVDGLLEVLRGIGCHEREEYKSFFSTYTGAVSAIR